INLRTQHPKTAKQIEKSYSIHPVSARVLAARDFKADEMLEVFLNPTLGKGLPPDTQLYGLQAGCELVEQIASDKQTVAICCDFDVDGLSGGSLLSSFLRDAGIENTVYVPDRFKDGYGLNAAMVQQAKADGHSLLICVDYGTTNHKELTLAREIGLRSIVIDHHHVGDHVVPADVFINPQQKNCKFADGILCAAGLVWYFTIGLKKYCKQASKLDPRRYLDLACLGTICDMVPLQGVNRVIAKRGLEMLSQTSRVGLQALKNVCGINQEVTGGHVGFGIGPRINAAGRMLDGNLVIELLTTSDSLRAKKIADRLNRLNLERQDTEAIIKDAAHEQVQSLSGLPYGIVCHGDDFHTGVIGIVAQRMVESYYRPTAVLGQENGIYKGSVRGIKDFSVVEALTDLGDILLKFGGHAGAGGFSIAPENLATFKQRFNETCMKRLEKVSLEPLSTADTTASLAEIDIRLVEDFKNFAPFGIGNAAPQLLVEDLKVQSVQVLKNAHLKVQFSDGKVSMPALMWRTTTHPAL
ncbi:MAG: single-stranded-DNA-specific exonuclease RecJ, partial [Bdellovibrionales bacterium]|nr:single-stranded-DNA-specific exonuclease RecJ [Bdellovibrionales bacterium]